MKIAIDARSWDWTGVGRYIRSLVHEYARLKTEHTFTLVVPREAELSAEVLKQPNLFQIERTDASYYSFSEQTTFLREISRIKADLFHFPHFNVPLRFGRPYVVTIHDTTRFVFSGQRRTGLFSQIAYEIVFAHAVKKARKIICVSKHTQEELLSLPILRAGDVARKNVQTIYEGVDEEFFRPVPELDRAKVRAMLGTKNPYVLYVGVWMSHKNLPRLLESFQLVKEKYPQLRLVVTGKPVPTYTKVLDRVKELHLEKEVIFSGFVPHPLLPALYREAELLIVPSLYEGFGLPALEAAALGTPVVASNVTSLPEIMGEAAEYVNPENTASIADGIQHLLANDQRSEELVKKGASQAGKFSWKTCAEETLSIYNGTN
ncbi:MAG: glycosyltransferase family 4 protein [Candidatus Andersenbacteria bacterium]|nr:glycosyltransferase family 4 protein [Candidatus Andersenbacteria bacterium]MBI3251079.1 glycosyltransferase family 4 protein [Candidatus Andersenbacteria bacterium]